MRLSRSMGTWGMQPQLLCGCSASIPHSCPLRALQADTTLSRRRHTPSAAPSSADNHHSGKVMVPQPEQVAGSLHQPQLSGVPWQWHRQYMSGSPALPHQPDDTGKRRCSMPELVVRVPCCSATHTLSTTNPCNCPLN